MEATASTSKTLIHSSSETKRRLMDPSTRWDHLLPPQKAKLFVNADLGDVDVAWSKLTKTAPCDRTAKFPEWKPSMFDNVDQRIYHDYFPMLMEMNSTEFRCVACRCVMSEVRGADCRPHQLGQLAYNLEDWYATPAMNYLPPQVTNLIAGAGGLWLCEGGSQPRAAIEHTQDVPYADAWEPGLFERDQTLMCVTNPLTKEYCYLPPFAYQLQQKSAILRIVEWDETILRPCGRERIPRAQPSEPRTPKPKPGALISPPPIPSSPTSGDPLTDDPSAEGKGKDGLQKKSGSPGAGPCSTGRRPRIPNCTRAPDVSPARTWNPMDDGHPSACTRCHGDRCALRFKYPRGCWSAFQHDATWLCPTGCTPRHDSATSTPAPTHREFAKLLQLPPGHRSNGWSVMRHSMPVLIPPGHTAAPGSPEQEPRISNQDFKDNETVILMDLNGREIGFGQVWKRKPGDMMDWKALKSHETAVVITRSVIDVDLEWERARYFGRRMKKKKIVGSKEAGKNNMMCSLPIRWPSSLLLRPFETNAAMKCQISLDHLEGRDNPSFGSPPIAQWLRSMVDPVKHPERQLRHPADDICYEKCWYGSSKRFLVVILGYHYLKHGNVSPEENLVVGVYESFAKQWTFKRVTEHRCKLMPNSQGKTGVALLGEHPHNMAIVFGGMAINCKPGKEETEECFEPTIFYCPLFSHKRPRKQLLFHGRKVDPTNCHQLFNYEMWPPVVVQPFREPNQCSAHAVTRKKNGFPEVAGTIYIVNVNLDNEGVPTGYFDLLSQMPHTHFQELLASATIFTPQHMEHASGNGFIVFKMGHNPKLVVYDTSGDSWFTTNYPLQTEGLSMKHWQLCDGVWTPNWKQRSGNNDLVLLSPP